MFHGQQRHIEISRAYDAPFRKRKQLALYVKTRKCAATLQNAFEESIAIQSIHAMVS